MTQEKQAKIDRLLVEHIYLAKHKELISYAHSILKNCSINNCPFCKELKELIK